MPNKPKRPLEEFAAEAKAKRVGAGCFICQLPERKDVERNYAKRVSLADIIGWLVECGYQAEDVRKSRISHHFYEKHHER